jgi:hypothetical protein
LERNVVYNGRISIASPLQSHPFDGIAFGTSTCCVENNNPVLPDQQVVPRSISMNIAHAHRQTQTPQSGYTRSQYRVAVHSKPLMTPRARQLLEEPQPNHTHTHLQFPMQASKPQPSQNQPTPSPPDSRPETMTSGALGSPTAGILNTKKNPSCVPPPPVNSPVTSLRTASCGRRCVERLWPVTRLGVRLVTHWETAWLWLAAS